MGSMSTLERVPEIMTPEQASAYLQVSRHTLYRLIREGRLTASRLGRRYRIPKHSLDLLLWATRARPDISLRAYTDAEIEEFLRADALDRDARAIVREFERTAGSAPAE